MTMLSPLVDPLLTRERLAEILASNSVTDAHLHLLRWLIWFPLLSVEEITRLEQSRLARSKQTRSRERVAAYLLQMEQLQLMSHVMVNEPGWPPHQHRYFLTDVGLSVFAALSKPPLSIGKLVQAYAIERVDLITRLAHIDIHLVLSDFSSRLMLEGSHAGYSVSSFQQPWTQIDTIFGHRQTLWLDAAFLLQSPQGAEHAFYVRVDTHERFPFEGNRERILLLRLLNLRHIHHLRQEAVPRLLIICSLSRLLEWGRLLETVSQQQDAVMLDGAITTLNHLHRAGVYGLSWWTFGELIEAGSLTALAAPATSLSDLRGSAISPMLAERFSQRRTFAHLLLEPENRPGQQPHKPLPSYVGKPLSHEIAALRRETLVDALRGTKAEQQEATALLNLMLSTTQKELLFWLTHQPLLTAHQLATLHYPAGRGDIRGVQKQMRGLASLHLLVPFTWYTPRGWQERERYLASDAALRYSALREGRPVKHYLLAEDEKERYQEKAFTIQQGTGGLFWQMHHTHGLYSCMVCLIQAAHREHIQVIAWKNARETIRTYPDPFTHVTMQVRPDAELVYQLEGQDVPQSILVEYDRATTSEREHQAKYQTYADYLEYTRLSLPPILVITQHEQAAAQIRACVDRIDIRLSVVIILQAHVQRQGLLVMLTQLDRSQ